MRTRDHWIPLLALMCGCERAEPSRAPDAAVDIGSGVDSAVGSGVDSAVGSGVDSAVGSGVDSAVASGIGNSMIDGNGAVHPLYAASGGTGIAFTFSTVSTGPTTYSGTVTALDPQGNLLWQKAVSLNPTIFGGFDFDMDSWTDVGVVQTQPAANNLTCGPLTPSCINYPTDKNTPGALCVMTQTSISVISGRLGTLTALISPLQDKCWDFTPQNPCPGGDCAVTSSMKLDTRVYPTRQVTNLSLLFGSGTGGLTFLPYYASQGFSYGFSGGTLSYNGYLYFPSGSWYDASYSAAQRNAYNQVNSSLLPSQDYITNSHVANGLIIQVAGAFRALFFTSARVVQYNIQSFGTTQLAFDKPFLTNNRTDIAGRNYGLVAVDPNYNANVLLVGGTDTWTMFKDLLYGFHASAGCGSGCTACASQLVGDDEWGQIERHVALYNSTTSALVAPAGPDVFYSYVHDACDSFKYEGRVVYAPNPFIKLGSGPSRNAYNVYSGGHWHLHITQPGNLTDTYSLQGDFLWDIQDLDGDGIDEILVSSTEPAGAPGSGYYYPQSPWQTVAYHWIESTASLQPVKAYSGVPYLGASPQFFRQPNRSTSRSFLYPVLTTTSPQCATATGATKCILMTTSSTTDSSHPNGTYVLQAL